MKLWSSWRCSPNNPRFPRRVESNEFFFPRRKHRRIGTCRDLLARFPPRVSFSRDCLERGNSTDRDAGVIDVSCRRRSTVREVTSLDFVRRRVGIVKKRRLRRPPLGRNDDDDFTRTGGWGRGTRGFRALINDRSAHKKGADRRHCRRPDRSRHRYYVFHSRCSPYFSFRVSPRGSQGEGARKGTAG